MIEEPLTVADPFAQDDRLWAMWVGLPPPRTCRGCPVTGWVHEGGPPWRVIVSQDPFKLFRLDGTSERIPYTGDEHTVDVDDFLRAPL